jgi:DNA polymerase III subunit chi
MRADFYQLSGTAPEAALPLIARASLAAGERLLVVSEDESQLGRIGDMLWSRLPESFLANGRDGEPHAERQPILLSTRAEPANGARFVALADGVWREGDPAFARAFLLFGEERLAEARACWRMLGAREGVERRFWKQDGGRWVEGP